MDFTIVIPFFNGHATIRKLVESIPDSIPVVIVDDQSDHPLNVDFGRNGKTQILHLNKKGYFTGAVNAGIQSCSNDVLILNQDSYFTGAAWLDFLAIHHETYGLIGEGVAGTHPLWVNGYIHGTFFYIRRDVIEKIGLLNDLDYPLWGSTCEYQLRAVRKGFLALPFRPIPDFYHLRHEGVRFGNSIQTILQREPKKQDLLIRVPPLISVIIPAYNHGRFLTDAVNSLIGGQTSLGFHPGQTFQSFEVIIVDDCSNDDTWETCQKLVDSFKGIRAFRHQTNRGTPTANNTGIQRAFGKYITVLCGDDMMESDRLERLYRAAIRNPGKFVYDDIQRFAFGKLTEKQTMQEYDFDTLIYKNQIHCGILLEKNAWKVAGGYPEEMRKGREDWAMNVRLGVNGICGFHLRNYHGYLYRREGHNRTLTNTTPKHHQDFLTQIRGLHPEAYLPKEARPMACCGGGRNKSKVTPMAAAVARLPGAIDGMTLLTYTGFNVGRVSFYGPVTGTRYEVSATNPTVNVDSRDVDQFLEMRKNKKSVFVLATPPEVTKTPVKVLEVQPVETPVETMPAAEIDNGDGGGPLFVPNPSDLTVSEFKELSLDAFAGWEISEMIEKEKDGKNRVTVVRILEDALK